MSTFDPVLRPKSGVLAGSMFTFSTSRRADVNLCQPYATRPALEGDAGKAASTAIPAPDIDHDLLGSQSRLNSCTRRKVMPGSVSLLTSRRKRSQAHSFGVRLFVSFICLPPEDSPDGRLTGEIGFWLDGKIQVCGAGSSVFIPRGTPHTFLVLSNTSSRHLVIMTPGGFEGFFVEMAAGQFAIPADMPQIEESAARFNLSFVGPPLAPADFGR